MSQNMVYYKNPSNGDVIGWDSSEPSSQPYIQKAKDDGWQNVTGSWPPAPNPDAITELTIGTATNSLQMVAYLTTIEMQTHITQESRQEVADYIHAVANILATAQSKYGTGEAYAPEFPKMPTVIPSNQMGRSAIPYIQFVTVDS